MFVTSFFLKLRHVDLLGSHVEAALQAGSIAWKAALEAPGSNRGGFT